MKIVGPSHFAETKAALERVSPSYCVAKWSQVTLHLGQGLTHSCHHNPVHQIPIGELAAAPSALHNTKKKQVERRRLLNGERPSGCSFCWKTEQLGPGVLSDRVLKSSESWSRDRLEEFAELPWHTHVNPSYVEVSFSNACNFKCSYCAPRFSSKWAAEIEEFGPYPTGRVLHNPIASPLPEKIDEDMNPYIHAFWKWFPDLKRDLKVLRLTGGEPLLSPNTFRLLDELKRNPNPELSFAINSNLGVADPLIDRFCEGIVDLLERRAVSDVMIYTSIDTWGRDAEYARHGLDLARFERNLERVSRLHPRVQVTIMCTFTAFSPFRFKELLEEIADWRIRQKRWIFLDVTYLMSPKHFDVRVLGELSRPWLDEAYDFAHARRKSYQTPFGFEAFEIAKLKRLLEYARSPVESDWLEDRRADFVRFIDEHDRRRGTDFAAVFPQLARELERWRRPLKFYEVAGIKILSSRLGPWAAAVLPEL